MTATNVPGTAGVTGSGAADATVPGTAGSKVPGAAPRPVPLALMRLVVTVHALAVFGQPVLAGLFLDGADRLVQVHGANAILIGLLGLGQILAAILLRWPGRGPVWPVAVSVLLWFFEVLQTGFGFIRVLSLHVPLGVAIVATLLMLLIWVWRPRLGR
ncbi:MAG TPA: hypothetical protein VIL37_02675 [Natronosporangium sp.]